ncbi:MAG TPA: FtsX-like permease family protein, partial [Nitrospira sp.]|nr:FtsX-like permease family protein [Nitrospira sp.]
LLRVLSVQPGFEPSHVLTIGLPLPSVEGLEPWQMKETDQVRRVQFLVGILTKVRALPGVRDAGGANTLPLTTGLSDGFYLIMNPGEKPPSEMKSLEQLFHDSSRTGDADYCAASEGYFRTLGIPLLRGRLFDERDTIDAPHVAVISESLAKEKWPGQDPLERQIEFGNMDGVLRLLTIVGVVGDVRESNLEAPPRPTVYVNVWQRPQTVQDFSIVLRTDSDPAAIFPAAREILRNAAPEIPPKFDTLDSVLAASTQSRRFNVTLVSVFAVTALLLALVGIFGVMAYTVSRRTREFGIRIALGAKKFDMLRLVIRQALVPGAVGVGVGAACALALTRLIQSLLFDVRATDPIIFLAAVLLLLFAIILASYLPARRATQVDPMVALRHE